MNSPITNTDIRALAIGIAGAFIVLAIQRIWTSYRRASIKQSLAYIKWERQHFEEIQKSLTEFSRSAFKSILLVLLFISCAGMLHALHTDPPVPPHILVYVFSYMEFVCWFAAIFTSFSFLRLYSSFKNPNEALARIDAKIVKLEKRVNDG